MSNDLHEMENQVTRGAAAAEPMQKVSGYVPDAGSIEDLGGPTPQNSKPTDDSNKLATPTKTIKQVKDVVNKGAKPADPMPKAPAYAEETEEEEVEVVSELLDQPMKKAYKTSSGQQRYTTGDGKTTGPAGAALYGAARKVLGKEEVESDEELIDETPEYDIEEDMSALFSGEELSEEFQEKAKTIFEAAISAKVAEIATQMEAKNEERIVEEIETVKSALVERVDAYLEYVADEWLQENEIAVEHGLKSEMTESFLSGMKELFEAHYVSIPEDKYDVVESMVNKLDEMETKLNEQIERNVSLNHRLAESVADGIVSEVAEGLALSQKEKLAQLAESVEFESETSYREKLVTLKESYFGQKVQKETSEKVLTEEAAPDYSGSMAQYMNILNQVAKK